MGGPWLRPVLGTTTSSAGCGEGGAEGFEHVGVRALEMSSVSCAG